MWRFQGNQQKTKFDVNGKPVVLSIKLHHLGMHAMTSNNPNDLEVLFRSAARTFAGFLLLVETEMLI